MRVRAKTVRRRDQPGQRNSHFLCGLHVCFSEPDKPTQWEDDNAKNCLQSVEPRPLNRKLSRTNVGPVLLPKGDLPREFFLL